MEELDRQVLLVVLAHLDLREPLERKVQQDSVGHLEVQEMLDRLDLLEIRDPRARLGHQEQSETQGSQDPQVHLVLAELSEQMDCQDQTVLRDLKDRLDSLGPLVQVVHPVQKATLDFRELPEHQVYLEQMGNQVLQDHKVLVEQTDSRDL